MTHTLDCENALLLVVDIQEAFAPYIRGMDRVIERSRILIEAIKLLDVPIIVSEQYPKGLGRTVGIIQTALGECRYYDKTAFSLCGDSAIKTAIEQSGKKQAILIGIETHVCIAQTAFDLLVSGVKPFLPADALSSRRISDHHIALERVGAAGAVVTTTEAAIMEMVRHSKHPAFKDISRLIK
ncbi:MAG: hydrolase [Sedimentisphaerales bacterium]|nr:hydrolase [Sedimentisphaerales bacterium]